MIATTFDRPINQTSPVSSTAPVSPRVVAEKKTEGAFESIHIAGNAIFRGYYTKDGNICKHFITSHNADDLSIERTFDGPESYDNISVHFVDENYLASISGCGAGAISYIWNRSNGNLIAKPFSSLRFAQKDISYVVETHVEKEKGNWGFLPRLWNLESGRFVGTLENADSLQGYPKIEGDTIFGGQKNGVIGCWDRYTGAFVRKIGEERESAKIQSLYVDPNLILAVEMEHIRVYDAKSGALIKSLTIPGASPNDEKASGQVSIYKDDLLEIKSYKKMQLWNLKEERLLYSIVEMRHLDTDEESHLFANVRAQIEVRNKWDGKLTATLEGHPAHRPIDMECKSSGRHLVSSSKDGLKVWNKAQGTLAVVLSEEPISGFVVKNERVTAQIGDTLKMWDLSVL